MTRENFLEWKAKFDAERRAAKHALIVTADKPKKLTGKELFERDAEIMVKSDVGFAGEDDGSVVVADMVVNATLFEGEEVDISDEEDDNGVANMLRNQN